MNTTNILCQHPLSVTKVYLEAMRETLTIRDHLSRSTVTLYM